MPQLAAQEQSQAHQEDHQDRRPQEEDAGQGEDEETDGSFHVFALLFKVFPAPAPRSGLRPAGPGRKHKGGVERKLNTA